MTFESGENFLAKLFAAGDDELLVFPFSRASRVHFLLPLVVFPGNGLDNEAHDFVIIQSQTVWLPIDHRTFFCGAAFKQAEGALAIFVY